ncbi:MAG: YceI family protein [Myxococcales bacterium]|nr:YceI family protein [Myxococcales bacterium]HRC56378.1 YceI family protein [Kofleriaceae bacterium]
MKKLSILFVAAALVFAGCNKKKEEAKAPPAPAEPAPAPAPEVKAPEPAPAPTPAPAADSISVFATHTEPKPVDPVEVKIPTFKVVKADFDPAKVEGGTAELELDLSSISTDDQKRTDHLKSPDFIDVAKFSTANVKIDNVKKTADNKFSADATVKFHGAEKKFAIAFDVTETMADGIKIQLEHKFSRLDFGVGKDSKDPKEAPVAPELTLKAALTLKKS